MKSARRRSQRNSSPFANRRAHVATAQAMGVHISSFRAALRMKDIASILLKYGFEELVNKLGMGGRKPWRKGGGSYQELSEAKKIRFAIEDLGATAIKIGQAAGMRPDLIPAELALELQELQEDIQPVPFPEIRGVLERSLGRPLDEMFSSFESEPVAAASLSQVHRAVLCATGETVAVKIRRPHVVDGIVADLNLLAYLAGLMHEKIDALRSANLPELVDELRKQLTRELNFINEAQNIAIFRQNFEGVPQVCAPKVHNEYVTEEVLVMEFIDGVRVDEYRGDEAARLELAEVGIHAAAKQLLEDGFFHADPHFGNVRIIKGDPNSPDGGKDCICYLDWGMVGRLTQKMQSAMVDYILALVRQDARKVAQVALDMAVSVPPLLDFEGFQTDVMFILDRLRVPVTGVVNLGLFLLELTTLCRTYEIHTRPDYVLMARALISLEAVGRSLSPDFDAMAGLKPLAVKYLIRRYSVLLSDKPIFEDLDHKVRDFLELPSQFKRVLNLFEAGGAGAEITITGMDSLFQNLRMAGNRVAEGLIVAALIVGSAMILVSDIGPHWNGLPIFGLLGFLVSGIFGFWLVLMIIFRKND